MSYRVAELSGNRVGGSKKMCTTGGREIKALQ